MHMAPFAGSGHAFAWQMRRRSADGAILRRLPTFGMKAPRLAELIDPTAMPFDAKRLFMGGFRMMIDA